MHPDPASAGPRVGTVVVPAGVVTLTDRRTRRSWAVPVATFELGVHAVTRDLWAEVTGAEAGTHGRRPADEVSWHEAIAVCTSLSAPVHVAATGARVRRRSHATFAVDDVGLRVARTVTG